MGVISGSMSRGSLAAQSRFSSDNFWLVSDKAIYELRSIRNKGAQFEQRKISSQREAYVIDYVMLARARARGRRPATSVTDATRANGLRAANGNRPGAGAGQWQLAV